MIETFENFLDKYYNLDTVYMDTLRNELVRFEHLKNACAEICTHTRNGMGCNGTAVRKTHINRTDGYHVSICPFPDNQHKGTKRFVPIALSNTRW